MRVGSNLNFRSNFKFLGFLETRFRDNFTSLPIPYDMGYRYFNCNFIFMKITKYNVLLTQSILKEKMAQNENT